ncbi:facilitated trehalose transporter Tret1-like [Sitophilus oryzae]|uniref:Facilitated trehalose transporter Tret1-like n=1 Tax=Sitophilus oryzae TaxID=7048 RepID=A0A6J2YTN5_SITOR|nr:facilitated trehalose transporter Tret1-like [Sitophilus oryzae]
MKISSTSNLKYENGNRIYQYVAAITANLGIVCSEMNYGWPSPSLPILVSGNYTFKVTSEESSWLVVSPLLGAILGALITGMIVDIVGRKRLILLSSFPFIASWICIALAKSSTVMFISRFVVGMTDGLSFTAVPMYLGEIADPQIRGLIASVCPVCIIFGILLINILGSYLSIPTTAYVSTIIPSLLFITFIWMPESPYFYLMKGKVAEAKKSLQKFSGLEDVSAELGRIKNAVREQNKNRGKCLDLVRIKSNRRALIIVYGLRGFQQLSGTTAIIFYCQKIFKESRDFMSPSSATIIYFSVQLVLSFLASIIVDFSGRRPLLIISFIGTAIMLFANGIYLYLKDSTNVDVSGVNFLPLAALLCYVTVFSIGLQTIPLLLMGEMFPTDVKAYALCGADIFYSVIVTIISKVFHWSNEQFGMYVPFLFFGVCCVLGLFFVVFCVPETKGKTLEDIQRELQSDN